MNAQKLLLIFNEELRKLCVDRMEFCRINNCEIGLENLSLLSDFGQLLAAVLRRPEFAEKEGGW